MKKLAYLTTMLFGVSALFLTGCKEDDTAPEITLIGDAHVMHPKGYPYADAGATATDNKDESVYVISDVSYYNPKHPDYDIADDYTITYTAQDRSGNISTATRIVSVTYTTWQLSHNYNVTDICLSDTLLSTSYVSSANPDTSSDYRTHFSNLMNFFTGDTYMDPVGKNISILKQKPDGASTPFTIEGSGTVSDSAGVVTIDIYYTFKDETNTLPTLNRHAIFVSF